MSMPYSYLVGWSQYNKYYYGARWANGCSSDDLWTTYFTSSKHVKDFRKKYGEPDIIQIRKIFDSADKCREYEHKVLRRLNVLKEEKWLNKNINGRFLPYGPQKENHIMNRVKSFISNGKRKGVTAWNKQTHPTSSQKISKALVGKPKTPQHIKSMRLRPQDTIVLTCPHCNKSGDYKNMMRWHMHRCKHNPNRISDKDPKTVTCTKCGYTAKASPNFYRNHNIHCKYHDQRFS